VRAWRATTPEELVAIDGVLLHAYLDADGIAHDAEARTLVVPFAQEAGEATLPPRRGAVDVPFLGGGSWSARSWTSPSTRASATPRCSSEHGPSPRSAW
jgi:hypothetical protein